jgi:hypothetical protein
MDNLPVRHLLDNFSSLTLSIAHSVNFLCPKKVSLSFYDSIGNTKKFFLVVRAGVGPATFSMPMLLTPLSKIARERLSTREEGVDFHGAALPIAPSNLEVIIEPKSSYFSTYG